MPTDVKNDPQSCLEIKENDIKIKDTHRYAEQVQFNMYVCNKTCCVDIEGKGCLPHFEKTKLSLIEEFYKRHIVPELLTRRSELTEE